MKSVINYILISIIFLGLLGFVLNRPLISKFDGDIPLSRIQNIQEINNKIYIGLADYDRVQVYNLKGKYLKFIPVGFHYKDFDFHVDTEENISSFITEQNLPKKYYFPQENKTSYSIKTKIPLVISKNQFNKSVDVIKQPLFFSIFAGPFSTWNIGFITMIIFVLININSISEVFGQNIDKEKKLKLLIHKLFGRN